MPLNKAAAIRSSMQMRLKGTRWTLLVAEAEARSEARLRLTRTCSANAARSPSLAPAAGIAPRGTEADQEIPGRRPGTPIPGSRPNRESGIGNREIPGFSEKKTGKNGGVPDSRRISRFRSDEHQLQWARNRLSREYHASALTGSTEVTHPAQGGEANRPVDSESAREDARERHADSIRICLALDPLDTRLPRPRISANFESVT